jgi:hypothetical protein
MPIILEETPACPEVDMAKAAPVPAAILQEFAAIHALFRAH